MTVRAAELLEQADRALEGTTPEPWMYVDGAIEGPNFTEVIAVEDLPRHAYPELQSGTLVLTEADGAFIAAARSLVPALAARLRDALTVVEALQERRAARDDLHRVYNTPFTEVMAERGLPPPGEEATLLDRASFGTEVYRPYQERVKTADVNLDAALAVFDAGPATAEETPGPERLRCECGHLHLRGPHGEDGGCPLCGCVTWAVPAEEPPRG